MPALVLLDLDVLFEDCHALILLHLLVQYYKNGTDGLSVTTYFLI